MIELDPQDAFYLTRASGWLELGNHLEANEELENITAASRSHPAVLEIRYLIYSNAGKWDACLDISRAILVQDKDNLSAWIWQAYALRRVPDGGLLAAYDALVPAADLFPFQVAPPFNLACYSAQLGNIEKAESWLVTAIKRAEGNFEGKEWKLKALDEPDLEPLWKAKGKDFVSVSRNDPLPNDRN